MTAVGIRDSGLWFVSSSDGKYAELQRIIPSLRHMRLDLPELQDERLEAVVSAKLNAAESQGLRFGVGCIVEDTSLEISGMHGLPGTFIKWFLKGLGTSGLARAAMNSGDTRAVARTMLGYRTADGRNILFEGSVTGNVVMPRGDGGFGWDPIFLPDGYTRTFGQMRPEEKDAMSMRGSAARKLQAYLVRQAASGGV